MGVSKNNGTPKSSILIGISIINHPYEYDERKTGKTDDNDTVDGRNPAPPGMYKNLVNNGINYRPQLVSLPDF